MPSDCLASALLIAATASQATRYLVTFVLLLPTSLHPLPSSIRPNYPSDCTCNHLHLHDTTNSLSRSSPILRMTAVRCLAVRPHQDRRDATSAEGISTLGASGWTE